MTDHCYKDIRDGVSEELAELLNCFCIILDTRMRQLFVFMSETHINLPKTYDCMTFEEVFNGKYYLVNEKFLAYYTARLKHNNDIRNTIFRECDWDDSNYTEYAKKLANKNMHEKNLLFKSYDHFYVYLLSNADAEEAYLKYPIGKILSGHLDSYQTGNLAPYVLEGLPLYRFLDSDALEKFKLDSLTLIEESDSNKISINDFGYKVKNHPDWVEMKRDGLLIKKVYLNKRDSIFCDKYNKVLFFGIFEDLQTPFYELNSPLLINYSEVYVSKDKNHTKKESKSESRIRLFKEFLNDPEYSTIVLADDGKTSLKTKKVFYNLLKEFYKKHKDSYPEGLCTAEFKEFMKINEITKMIRFITSNRSK